MLTISLDEQGDFENLNNEIDTKPVFIGGIIYDDTGDKNDCENERKRLEEYLKAICKSAHIRYPEDLHFDGNPKDDNNSEAVFKFKYVFGKTIKEFLETGTWNGKQLNKYKRAGKYYIFANVRGENGKENLLGTHISQAVRDNFASNLYVHMAEDVIERLIFHNPVNENITKVRLELATRVAVLRQDETAKAAEYEKLGFGQIPNRSGRRIYSLTNMDNYRTAIEREMLNSGNYSIMIDNIDVKSIKYDDSYNGMEFLYLSDAICSYLAYKVPGKTPTEWINEFSNRSSAINSNVKNLIWSYDMTDDYFGKAIKAYENNDYYSALYMIFDGTYSDRGTAQFYKKYWQPCIIKAFAKKADSLSVSLAVRRLKDYVTSNNINQHKLIFIYKELEKITEKVDFANKKEESVLYDLYDTGISAYIHVGDAEGAMKCYEKAKKYAGYVATETYLRTRNKICVYLCDTLRFREAYEVADENVKYHEILSDMKKKLFGDSYSDALNHAIALSQRGQVFAFMGDTRAEDDFKKALSMMDKETPDYLITQSYLLHYYICQHKKEKYEEAALEYFSGKEDLNAQFIYLVKEGSKGIKARFSLKYALFIFVKALYVFYFHDLPDNLVCKLTNIEESMLKISKKAPSQMNGHPWEIIYKYLALIMLYNENDEAAARYRHQIEAQFGSGAGIINLIAKESINNIDRAKKEEDLHYEYSYMYC